MRRLGFVVVLLAFAGLTLQCLADRVELKDGKVFYGKVLLNNKEKVSLEAIRGGTSMTNVWPASEVASVIVDGATTRPVAAPTTQELARQKLLDEEKARRDAEQQRFEEAQRARGLAKFQNRWVPAADVSDLEKADAYVMSKAKRNLTFRVFQALPNGGLCMAEAGRATGEVFMVVDATSKTLADGDRYTCTLYWAGTYTYTTKLLEEKTVNCYCSSREVAQEAVRKGLFGHDVPGTVAPNPSITRGREQVTAARAEPQSSGSGFIITRDGYLLTNYHVVRDAHQLSVVTEAGRVVLARVITKDPDNDLVHCHTMTLG